MNAIITDALLDAAKAICRRRQRRWNYFPSFRANLGEPCWDMMLDLFIEQRQGREISVSSVVLASGVPTTTGLRWLQLMEAHGLVHRKADITDGRRTLVHLTSSAMEAMERYIEVEILSGRAAVAAAAS